jgi:hypothetical protein
MMDSLISIVDNSKSRHGLCGTGLRFVGMEVDSVSRIIRV